MIGSSVDSLTWLVLMSMLTGMLKIAGGIYRGRKLVSPPDAALTRPWPQRVRESAFNLLRGWFEDANVLDLYAGVGSMGLEAVSRGAKSVLLVERQRAIFSLLEENIQSLDCGDRATALMGDALGQIVAVRAPRPIEVVFIDPPYAFMKDDETRQRILAHPQSLSPIMTDQGWLVLRTPLDPSQVDHEITGFEGPEVHKYGASMWMLLYQQSTAPQSE